MHNFETVSPFGGKSQMEKFMVTFDLACGSIYFLFSALRILVKAFFSLASQ